MTIDLGENPWFLILLILLEPLLIIIPALLSSKIKKTSLKEEFKYIGFSRRTDSSKRYFWEVIAGISLGFIFYLVGGYILYFFRDILIKSLFGTSFIDKAQDGSIKTTPIRPNFLQMMIILILHIIIVAPCEEGFFRGFIFKKIEGKMNYLYAILLSSICFAIYHTPPIIVSIATIITFFGYYFTFGILLALIFKIFDYSLIPCIISHGLFNILILIF